mmetsp:Transcript_29128/g.38310  ORF Transcript_29128/g.38310 Transcript_29128/m.38310 type:complete len:260 (-) Transcript_29128:236-1015(-)
MGSLDLSFWFVIGCYLLVVLNSPLVDGSTSSGLMQKPFTVVLTGGPCGGKTTSLPELKRCLEEAGYKVFTIPESATLLQVGGVERLALVSDEQKIDFQTSILDIQMNLEKNFQRMARACGRRAVLLLDRGALDPKGYIPRYLWKQVLQRLGLTEKDLLKRYDMVLHLVSTANGAEDFYDQQNNHIRIETVEDSRRQDLKELGSWRRHPRRVVIDNSTGWAHKMQRAAKAIKENLEQIEMSESNSEDERQLEFGHNHNSV